MPSRTPWLPSLHGHLLEQVFFCFLQAFVLRHTQINGPVLAAAPTALPAALPASPTALPGAGTDGGGAPLRAPSVAGAAASTSPLFPQKVAKALPDLKPVLEEKWLYFPSLEEAICITDLCPLYTKQGKFFLDQDTLLDCFSVLITQIHDDEDTYEVELPDGSKADGVSRGQLFTVLERAP